MSAFGVRLADHRLPSAGWAEPLKWRDRPPYWRTWRDKIDIELEPIFALPEGDDLVEMLEVVPNNEDGLEITIGTGYSMEGRDLTRDDVARLVGALQAWLAGWRE